MGAVVTRETGLRTARRISHCFVMDVPGHPDALIITDAAINIAPTLEEKVDIVQNAIDLAHALRRGRAAGRDPLGDGNGQLEDAVHDRSRGAVQDGRPRADHGRHPRRPARARQRDQPRGREHQGDQSPVAGRANMLVVPDLEAGNMLAKSLTFLAGADAAGIVLGARVPIILTSRADSVTTRLASCAVAALVAKARREARRRPSSEAGAMADAIVVLNAGSSSIKFSLFLDAGRRARPRRRAARSKGSARAALRREAARRDDQSPRSVGRGRRTSATTARSITWSQLLRPNSRDERLVGVGHRVVHGGLDFTQPVRVDAGVLAELEQLVPLAPLHQPHNLAPIRRLLERAARAAAGRLLRHGVPPHATPTSPQRFALPAGLARGRACGATASTACRTSTSRRCCRSSTRMRRPARPSCCTSATARACARIEAGRSVASTMGFTALDGLPMGTRCGALDPGVVLYLMDQRGMDARAIEKLLYNQSGLLGVSGISSDMRTLLARGRSAREARGRSVLLPHPPRTRLARRRARRARCARVHRRHRRERGRDPRARLPRCGLARRRARRGRERRGRPAHQHARRPRVGVDDPDQRRTDDRPAHPVGCCERTEHTGERHGDRADDGITVSRQPTCTTGTGFATGLWQNEINVRDFIQQNYTPYDGDESLPRRADPHVEA